MKKFFLLLCFGLALSSNVRGQNTEIRGFADFNASFSKDNVSFYLVEQDLFITSEISDRISFLGESVFKFSAPSPTRFDVSIERIVLKYNIIGNHNILLGKHHTPVSYWNDVYHHGRVFYPTVNRPVIFSDHVVELHTTGIAFQGLNLGKHNIGYQVMIGNGIGSSDSRDNNMFKSLSVDLHAKPHYNMRFGVTAYYDRFRHEGFGMPDTVLLNFNQLLNGAYFAYNGSKFEVLTEAFLVHNNSDESGQTLNTALYAYGGYRAAEKVVPYIRYDFASYDEDDLYFTPGTRQILVGGVRYEFNYLAVAKLEYNRTLRQNLPNSGQFLFQFAVGF